MSIRDYNDAKQLLSDLISIDRYTTRNLNNPDGYFRHCTSVSDNASRMALQLNVKGVKSDAGKVKISGLLHDIGKLVITPESLEYDPELVLDSIHGYEYLNSIGENDIATTILPSFTVHEMKLICPGIFPDYSPDRFIPATIEQKLVVYGDISSGPDGEYMTFEKRMEELKSRYPDDSLLIQSLDKGGEERLRKLFEEIQKLASGI